VNGTFKLAVPLVAALALAACNGGSSSVPTSTGMTGTPGQSVFTQLRHPAPDWQTKHQAHAVCPQVIGKPTCLALKVDKGIQPACVGASCGWAPLDLQTRYKLPITQGSGQIVAIVDAYDQPNAASDLATYRTQFGLGTANFTKFNQNGQQSNYPQSCTVSSGWCVEEDLDIEMVSAACPLCTIYLIENDGTNTGFESSETTAVNLGAHIVSNSWICYGSPNCGDTNFPNFFNTPGVEFLAASGDAGYDQNGGPEALATVVSVGGTQLAKNGSTYSETAWNGAGGGCSNNGGGSGVTKPSWQHDPSCTWRTDSDISAEAGISPGVAEYDSLQGGWFGVGGTSVASPLIAGVFALDGNASSLTDGRKFWLRDRKHLHRVLSGNDGSCGGSYLCQAGTHQFGVYSGPAGFGSPNGVLGF
jgi:hypothetical protein